MTDVSISGNQRSEIISKLFLCNAPAAAWEREGKGNFSCGINPSLPAKYHKIPIKLLFKKKIIIR